MSRAWKSCVQVGDGRCPGRARMWSRVAGILIVLCVVVVTAARGGPNANSKILFHVKQNPFTLNCRSPAVLVPCATIRVAGDLYPPLAGFAVLLVVDGSSSDGVGAMACGIEYDARPLSGVDIFTWSLCGDREAPVAGPNGMWPASLSSNLICWDTPHCERYEPGGPGSGVVANAGFLYLAAYSPDSLTLIPSPDSGVATVMSCQAEVDTVAGGNAVRIPSHLGIARFSMGGLEPGYNPCGLVTPVEASTWSQVKGLFR